MARIGKISCALALVGVVMLVCGLETDFQRYRPWGGAWHGWRYWFLAPENSQTFSTNNGGTKEGNSLLFEGVFVCNFSKEIKPDIFPLNRGINFIVTKNPIWPDSRIHCRAVREETIGVGSQYGRKECETHSPHGERNFTPISPMVVLIGWMLTFWGTLQSIRGRHLIGAGALFLGGAFICSGLMLMFGVL